MKVFRSPISKDLEVFQAAVALCLEAPRLESFAMVGRRLGQAFLSQDPWKRKAILQLVRDDRELLQDLRFVNFLSEALRDSDPALADLALSRNYSELRELPAVAESLIHVSGKSATSELKLPSLEFFRDLVLLLLEKSGPMTSPALTATDRTLSSAWNQLLTGPGRKTYRVSAARPCEF